jgi:nanoRNase/pAp phosphatase (c-di-AMP/oligoRNAs hydrolase)
MKTHLLYHRADADGILSAAIVCHANGLNLNNSILYPVDYPEPCPLLIYSDTIEPFLDLSKVAEDDHIIIVDYSYSAPEMVALLPCNKVTLYDHHAKALQELGDMLASHPTWILDKTRAACQIVWDDLVGTPHPWWLNLVGWRDLGGPWQPDADTTHTFEAHTLNTALFTFAPLNPHELSTCLHPLNQHRLLTWFEEAAALSQLQQATAKALAPHHQKQVLGTVGAIPVLFNVHRALISDAIAALLDHTGEPIAGVINRDDQHPYHYKWSLRSRPGHNVNAIAQRFGGGGHPQAAGFTTISLS